MRINKNNSIGTCRMIDDQDPYWHGRWVSGRILGYYFSFTFSWKIKYLPRI